MRRGQFRNKDVEDFPGKEDTKGPTNQKTSFRVLFLSPWGFYISGSSEAVVLSQEPCCPPGDMWPCLGTFLVVTSGGVEGGGAMASPGQRPGMLLKHPTGHRGLRPHAQNYPAPGVDSAQVEKPCSL